MSTEVSDLVTPDLVTETAVDATRVQARLVGCAEAASLEDFTLYLDAVRRAAAAANAEEIVLDFRSLEFMSAACLRSLVVWIGDSQRASSRPLRMVWDPMRPWQRRSLPNILSEGGEFVRLVRPAPAE